MLIPHGQHVQAEMGNIMARNRSVTVETDDQPGGMGAGTGWPRSSSPASPGPGLASGQGLAAVAMRVVGSNEDAETAVAEAHVVAQQYRPRRAPGRLGLGSREGSQDRPCGALESRRGREVFEAVAAP